MFLGLFKGSSTLFSCLAWSAWPTQTWPHLILKLLRHAVVAPVPVSLCSSTCFQGQKVFCFHSGMDKIVQLPPDSYASPPPPFFFTGPGSSSTNWLCTPTFTNPLHSHHLKTWSWLVPQWQHWLLGSASHVVASQILAEFQSEKVCVWGGGSHYTSSSSAFASIPPMQFYLSSPISL